MKGIEEEGWQPVPLCSISLRCADGGKEERGRGGETRTVGVSPGGPEGARFRQIAAWFFRARRALGEWGDSEEWALCPAAGSEPGQLLAVLGFGGFPSTCGTPAGQPDLPVLLGLFYVPWWLSDVHGMPAFRQARKINRGGAFFLRFALCCGSRPVSSPLRSQELVCASKDYCDN